MRREKESIHARIARARKHLGVTQPEMSGRTGIPVSSLDKYEGGHSKPGTDALAQIAACGINIHWLVTGDGPMMLSELQPRGALDAPLLQASIEGVEEALRATGRDMSPAKKAELVLAIYDLYAGAAAPLDKSRVLRLVKTAVGSG